jgi:hypothetical protein
MNKVHGISNVIFYKQLIENKNKNNLNKNKVPTIHYEKIYNFKNICLKYTWNILKIFHYFIAYPKIHFDVKCFVKYANGAPLKVWMAPYTH